MTETTMAAKQLLAEFGDLVSADRAAAARSQTACNAIDRRFWSGVRLVLAAAEDQRTSTSPTPRD